MSLSPLILIINACFIAAGLFIMITIMRLSSRHQYNYGLADIQIPLMKRILKRLLLLILLALTATLFNFGLNFWQKEIQKNNQEKTAPSASAERAVR